MNAVPCVLRDLAENFADDPDYLKDKGFTLVTCGKRAHIITLEEFNR